MSEDHERCTLCNLELNRKGAVITTLREKGCAKIHEASEKRGVQVATFPSQRVHEKCRNEFCHEFYIERDNKRKISIENDEKEGTPAKLRSRQQFSFATDCLFCGVEVCKFPREKYYPVRTLDFQETLLDICKDRKDEWANTVNARIQSVSDLHAADALYHQACSSNFRTRRGIPKKYIAESQLNSSTINRPEINQDFIEITRFLERNSADQLTVSDLVDKMKESCGEKAFSVVWMKQKLKDFYGDSIIISELHGKSNVITFRKTAAAILHDFFKQGSKHEEEDEQKTKIIKAAAELIRSEILEIESDRSSYITPRDLSDIEKNLEAVPKSLRNLLTNIYGSNRSDLKISAVGQSIVQTTRPRSILCPLQLGLGVQVHHLYASRFLVDILFSLGFSISYSEVQKFEASAALQKQNDSYNIQPDEFLQFVADNVDHNTDTLDGKNTFHGMGIIASVTPRPKGTFGRQIPRCDTKAEEIAKLCNVEIHFYSSTSSATKQQFEELLHIQNECFHQMKMDLLTKLVRPLKSPVPLWSGAMQFVSSGPYPGKSMIDFLPIIDMNASDLSCVFSTLLFVSKEAEKYGREAVITFDQPLYWKAILIIEEKALIGLIVRLGAFHMQMSYLGSIGHIMSGSGLKAVLEGVYASNSVNHMLSGKAVSRAVRGYMLVDAALALLIYEHAFEDPNMDSSQADVSSSKLQHVVQLHEQLTSGQLTLDQLATDDNFKDIEYELEKCMSSLRSSRTSQLWLNFMDMITLLKKFITAERTGNWSLHLTAVHEMLPYFAASGHNLYAKSAYVYLNQMQKLEISHPNVYAFFKNGHHVLRRSNKYWAGLSTDLTIEQVLMRSIKSTGGLTRGRGMGECQRAVWLFSMPATADVNFSMQTLCELHYTSSDQHIDSTETRMTKDHKDIVSLRDYLRDHNPFSEDKMLRSIETGQVADQDVTCDSAQAIGRTILQKMVGSIITNYTFRRKDQVVTLSMKTKDSSKQDRIAPIDPQLMFQRLLVTAEDSLSSSSELFQYELASVPTSLFDENGLPREATKYTLAESIWDNEQCSASDVNSRKFVIDGGSLLQRIPWLAGKTFSQICEAYIDHIQRNYSLSDVTVVFDSYPEGPTTKDMTHMRRSKGQITDFLFTEDMPCRIKKELFLTNKRNKQRFINLLVSKMNEKGISTVQAADDADVPLVETAIEISQNYQVTVLAEDTDVLVLLLHHAGKAEKKITFKSEKKSIGKETKHWDIQKTAHFLGVDICKLLPFIHALTGCDTASKLFGIGKNQALKKLRSSEYLQSLGRVFLDSNSSKEEVIKSGEEAIACLYGGLQCEGLQILRWRKFTSKIIANRSKSVTINTLPPTPDAAKYHSLRTYYQCQVWAQNVSKNPIEWGWEIEKDVLVPVKMTLPPAPEELMSIIRCSCRSGCETRRCSCRKSGLECTIACGECRGISCSNARLDEDVDNQET